jgi:hypothetical protein
VSALDAALDGLGHPAGAGEDSRGAGLLRGGPSAARPGASLADPPDPAPSAPHAVPGWLSPDLEQARRESRPHVIFAGLSVPRTYLCPFDGRLLNEPVVAEDGVVYEQSTLQMWLMANNVSPTTGRPMGSDFVLNNGLQDEIVAWVAEHVPLPPELLRD